MIQIYQLTKAEVEKQFWGGKYPKETEVVSDEDTPKDWTYGDILDNLGIDYNIIFDGYVRVYAVYNLQTANYGDDLVFLKSEGDVEYWGELKE